MIFFLSSTCRSGCWHRVCTSCNGVQPWNDWKRGALLAWQKLTLWICCCCCRHLSLIFLVSGYMKLFVRCCSCAMRLVGQPKTKRLGHPEWFFLIELLGLFFLIPAKWERRREKQQRALKKTTLNAANTSFFRLSGNIETLQGRLCYQLRHMQL